MEEEETECSCSFDSYSNMGPARSLSFQLPYCIFMGGHVCCYFFVPLGQHT